MTDERTAVIDAVEHARFIRGGDAPPEQLVADWLFVRHGIVMTAKRIHDYAIAEGLQTLEHSAMVEDEPTRKLSPVR